MVIREDVHLHRDGHDPFPYIKIHLPFRPNVAAVCHRAYLSSQCIRMVEPVYV